MAVQWHSDQQHVVLEVSDPESKSTTDSERCPWYQLLAELEDAGATDPTINSHDLMAPTVDGSTGLRSLKKKQR